MYKHQKLGASNYISYLGPLCLYPTAVAYLDLLAPHQVDVHVPALLTGDRDREGHGGVQDGLVPLAGSSLSGKVGIIVSKAQHSTVSVA